MKYFQESSDCNLEVALTGREITLTLEKDSYIIKQTIKFLLNRVKVVLKLEYLSV